MSKTTTRPAWRIEADRQGINLSELARRTGVTTRAIYAYSTQARKPSPAWVATVERVLAALDDAREIAS